MANNGRQYVLDKTNQDLTSVYERRDEFGNPLGPISVSPQTFAGSDISVIFTIPLANTVYAPFNKPYKLMAELQTLTISSTTSMSPIRSVGWSKARSYNKGARTFAGSMVFTIINKDPFQEIFAIDALNNSVSSDGHWHIDQMPPFDIIIVAQNETGGVGVQIIHDVTLSHWGTTLSIDDMYTESTYTYVAEHVTPFIFDPLNTVRFYDLLQKMLNKNSNSNPATPDTILSRVNNDLDNFLVNAASIVNSNKYNQLSYDKTPTDISIIGGFQKVIKDTSIGDNKVFIINTNYGLFTEPTYKKYTSKDLKYLKDYL